MTLESINENSEQEQKLGNVFNKIDKLKEDKSLKNDFARDPNINVVRFLSSIQNTLNTQFVLGKDNEHVVKGIVNRMTQFLDNNPELKGDEYETFRIGYDSVIAAINNELV